MARLIRVLGCRQPAFRICGGIGLVLAIALSLGLAWARGLERGVVLGLALVCIVSFLALVMARKIISWAVNGWCTTITKSRRYLRAVDFFLISRRSVLPYLDITILGVGVFLACGRIGWPAGRLLPAGPRSAGLAIGPSTSLRGLSHASVAYGCFRWRHWKRFAC